MTSVLVTGAGGFIGSALLASGPRWDIHAVSRTEPSVEVARWIALDTVRKAAGTIEGPFDAVVHLAGNADHAISERAPWLDAEATAVLAAEILGRTKAAHLVVLSSAAVYAGNEGEVGPSTPLDPRMPYALSKLYVEGLARALQDRGRFDSLTVLRLYNAFGPGERSTRLVPRVALAARSGAPFRLTGSPSSLADPLYVDDVVRSLIAAVAVRPSGTYDLCGGKAKPLSEQVPIISRALGYGELPVVMEPNPGEVPIRFWSEPTGTWRALGLESPEPFNLAVRRYGQAMGWLRVSQDDQAPVA